MEKRVFKMRATTNYSYVIVARTAQEALKRGLKLARRESDFPRTVRIEHLEDVGALSE